LLGSEEFGMHSDEVSDQRLVLASPVVTGALMVRQLVSGDGDLLADAASEVDVVKGRLKVPGSSDEASSMLAEWEDLRNAARGNLFGIFDPDGTRLTGVLAFWLTDELVAEGATWSRSDSRSRTTTAAGMDVILQLAHEQMGVLRVWADVDPLDPFTKYLGIKGGLVLEGEVTQPDGSVLHRYSSV
jgi:RimJ/RimL family protein N-acetyltransferase